MFVFVFCLFVYFFCCSFLYMNINLELYINWKTFNISKLSILWLPTIASIPYAIIGNKPTENINKYNAYFDFRHVILTQQQTTKWFHKSNFILIITSTKIERKLLLTPKHFNQKIIKMKYQIVLAVFLILRIVYSKGRQQKCIFIVMFRNVTPLIISNEMNLI